MISKSKILFCLSMFVFGTIGVFRRFIPLPSGFVVMARGVIATVFVLLFLFATHKKPDLKIIKKNGVKLILSGILIAVNWVLLFESYSYTTVAVATLCYYMAPIFLLILTPFIFKEKISKRGICCIIFSAIGMVLISGVLDSTGGSSKRNVIGIILGLVAAILYCFIIIINKSLTPDLSAYDKTAVQMIVAAISVMPYVLLAESVSVADFTPLCVLLLVTLGVVHTGICYIFYFGSIQKIPSKTVAILSYIDPMVAVLLSALFLKEPMTPISVAGAVLIIGSAILSELPETK